MSEKKIDSEDLEYVADMLRAVAYFKEEIETVSASTLEELEASLLMAEAALRRAISEMSSNPRLDEQIRK